MRLVTTAAAVLALLAAPAYAQLNSKRHAGDAQKKTDSGAPKGSAKRRTPVRGAADVRLLTCSP